MGEEQNENNNNENTIHFSLLYPLTLGGIDKRLAALILMSAGILYIVFRSYVIFLPIILFYLTLRSFYKKDMFILDVYKQFIFVKKKYYK
jgi:type IV secretory pathway VirB3-like protein